VFAPELGTAFWQCNEAGHLECRI